MRKIIEYKRSFTLIALTQKLILSCMILHSLRVQEVPELLRQARGERGQVRRALGPHAAVHAHEVAVVDGARLRPRVEPGNAQHIIYFISFCSLGT